MTRLSDKNIAELSGPDGLKAKLTPPKQRKVQANDEWKIERAVYVWWLANSSQFEVDHRLYFSVPNGAALGFGKEDYQKKGSAIRGRMMKLIGLQPGFPDKMLAVQRKGCGALFIEFKTPTGTVSEEQLRIHRVLIAFGYQAHVCRSCEEAIKVITEYLT